MRNCELDLIAKELMRSIYTVRVAGKSLWVFNIWDKFITNLPDLLISDLSANIRIDSSMRFLCILLMVKNKEMNRDD